MQARMTIQVECPTCQQTMLRLPKHYWVQCVNQSCSQSMILYELPEITLKPVDQTEQPEIDESKLVEVLPE